MPNASGMRADEATPPNIMQQTATGPAIPADWPAGGRSTGRLGRRELERRGRTRRRLRHNRHLVDALAPSERLTLRTIIALWIVVTAWTITWWVQPDHWAGGAGVAVSSALVGIELVVLPIWFYTWLWRMKRPDDTLPVPHLRTAIIVTKAPSEPWVVVRETLEAMLAQDLPMPYDTWLADEQPDARTRRWCAAHGVRLSTRHGVRAYHRATWPRRTRCKEGNLAFFYDIWGYEHYDVVAQLDADHVPEPDYLRRMLTPFTDPIVGYVAAPSICDRNAARSWAARGRLYAEAVLHGPTQAGHSGGYAPSCIGSHYAVRTSALHEIGGLGPELAEDFTTTLMMSAHGWQGVFAIDAEAHGDGPECLADGLTQEFQWSRSMMNVLLGINGRYWEGLTWRAKTRLGFCQLWYPLFGLLMVAPVVLPLVAVFTRTPLMTVSFGDFYLHVVPPMLVLLLTVMWLRRLDWLRPRTAKAFSWEGVLFQLVRWPWALLGCLHAVAGRVAGREFAFKVTPKGRDGAAPLPLRVVAPYLLVACVSAFPVLAGLDAGAADGYLTLTLINAVLYGTCSVVVVAVHVAEQRPGLRRQAVAMVRLPALGALVVAGVVAGSIALHAGWAATGSESVAVAAERLPSSDRPTIGVTTDALARNSTQPWDAGDLAEVNGFERDIRTHVGVVMWFADWEHNARPDQRQLRRIAERGSVPEISWEPWDYEVGVRRPQPEYRLARIADGTHDAYIRTWARGLKAYGGPVRLRFGHEMNGDWYPWAEAANGNRHGDYRRAWRHLHDLFAREGVTNVRWVWSPVARHVSPRTFPGAAYVDVVGLSGFNGGTELAWSGWRTFASIFDESLARLGAMAPGKPIEISEVSSAETGGDKGAWIRSMFAYLRRHPQIGTVVWFNVRKQADWRIQSSPQARRAFAHAVAVGRRAEQRARAKPRPAPSRPCGAGPPPGGWLMPAPCAPKP